MRQNLRTVTVMLACAAIALTIAAAQAPAQSGLQSATGPIRLEVDSTHSPQKILHVHMVMPAQAGPLTLYYPEWIPGEHQPSGPIINVAGLKITANGKILSWRRDLVDVYAINLAVPQGVSSLDIHFDFLLSAASSGFSSGASATSALNLISWNHVVLYPKGYDADKIQVIPSLRIPDGWKFGTALPGAKQEGDTVNFSPVSLETLIDSPVLIGHYFRVFPLSEQPVHVEMDVAADSPDDLNMPPETEAAYRKLVAEAYALFQSHHYRDYHFLVSLSDNVAHFGLEHHESSDDRVFAKFLTDETTRVASAYLLPHEYTHSWNGKYRRPADLISPDYHKPMQDDLLWVYEGLTDYWGEILAARSGLWTPEQAREYFAHTAGLLDEEPGRQWRPLQDTADAAVFLYDADNDWFTWRRGTDFYQEGDFLWLGVDDTIRRITNGQKSLDDFGRLFHGGTSGQPDLSGYSFDDVVNALNQVAPYEWGDYLHARLDSLAPNTMDEAIDASGWKLVYNDEPNSVQDDRNKVAKALDLYNSIGLYVGLDGTVKDVLYDGPAYKADMGPEMVLTAVNGRVLTPDNMVEEMHDAIVAAEKDKSPIKITATNGAEVQTYSIEYHGGLRYAHLVRDESRPDVFSEILKSLTK